MSARPFRISFCSNWGRRQILAQMQSGTQIQYGQCVVLAQTSSVTHGSYCVSRQGSVAPLPPVAAPQSALPIGYPAGPSTNNRHDGHNARLMQPTSAPYQPPHQVRKHCH